MARQRMTAHPDQFSTTPRLLVVTGRTPMGASVECRSVLPQAALIRPCINGEFHDQKRQRYFQWERDFEPGVHLWIGSRRHYRGVASVKSRNKSRLDRREP